MRVLFDANGKCSIYRRRPHLEDRPSQPAVAGAQETAKEQLPPGDHIIFNPPSSAANVYHTPPKFLPPTDPRKKLFEETPKLSQADPQEPTTPSPLAFPSILQPRSATPVTAIGTNFANAWPETPLSTATCQSDCAQKIPPWSARN